MPKQQAMDIMRDHVWLLNDNTWVQGAFLQMFQKGTLT